MKNKKLIMTSAISTALIALLLVFFGPNVANIVKDAQDKSLGATSSQVTDGDCLFANGMHLCPFKVGISATSTMLCTIKSPAATTTLVSFAMNVFSAGSIPSSVVFDISTSSIPFATSSPTYSVNNVFGTGYFALPMTWATTSINNNRVMSPINAQGLSNMVVGPSTYLVVKTSTTTIATTYPTGSCSGEFDY